MERFEFRVDPETFARILNGKECPLPNCGGMLGFSFRTDGKGVIIKESVSIACDRCNTDFLSKDKEIVLKT